MPQDSLSSNNSSTNSERGASKQPTASKQQTATGTRRPTSRNSRKKKLALASQMGASMRVCVLGALTVGFSIFLLVGKRPTMSAEENRALAKFPKFSMSSFLDGSYTAGISTFYNDTVPCRSNFKSMIATLKSHAGKQSDDTAVFFGDIAAVKSNGQNTQSDSDPATTDAAAASTEVPNGSTPAITTTTQAEPDTPPVEIGDGIILVDKRAINVYGGSFTNGDEYASYLNQFQQQLGSKVQVYSLVAPTAVSFYLPSGYASYTGSEIDNIDNINKHLSGVKPVDAYHALEAHTSENIYARTDHHWLPLGAYYAAQEFAKTANVPFPDLSTGYTATTKSDYVGTMYSFTNSATLRDNPEDFTYYTPKNHYTTYYYDTSYNNEYTGDLLINLDNVDPVSYYLVFMGGDEKITKIQTDCTNQRKLVIIKDSYGNALVPCLTSSFSEIYVIDMRYFNLNAVSFIKQVGATDVLFAMNTFSATGGNRTCLQTLLTQ